MTSPVTLLLQRAERGEPSAASELLPLVYDELRALAAARLAALPPGQTLQATALVHDAYIKLVGTADPGWEGRRHFFGAAANAMRQILVDAARRKQAARHGEGRVRAGVDEQQAPEVRMSSSVDVLALDEGLRQLERDHPDKAEMVLLRCVLGLSREDVAATLGMSTRTLDRHWRFIVATMHRAMTGLDESEGGA